MALALEDVASVTAERIRQTHSDAVRRRALERLYQRRDAVDQLIQSLEEYQTAAAPMLGVVVPITSAGMWSSGSAL